MTAESRMISECGTKWTSMLFTTSFLLWMICGSCLLGRHPRQRWWLRASKSTTWWTAPAPQATSWAELRKLLRALAEVPSYSTPSRSSSDSGRRNRHISSLSIASAVTESIKAPSATHSICQQVTSTKTQCETRLIARESTKDTTWAT